MVYEKLQDLVGNTPLFKFDKLKTNFNLKANVFGKLECYNPTGSVKDRIALAMILDAEEKGLAKPGTTFIEPTSGNTGIGIAAIATSRGYRSIIVMPESMSLERRMTIQSFGAELVLTEAAKGMPGSIEKANELLKEIPNSIILGQFDNPINPVAHYKTTGPEIYKDLDGKVDILIAGVGTGGTITGTGKYLKEQNPDVKVIAVEPKGSPVLTEGHGGKHRIQGIGAGFVPKVLDLSVVDEIIDIEDEEAFKYGKAICNIEGISAGISSGAALAAAVKVASREENKGKNIVVILPDGGNKYLSTDLYK